jgi:threonine aldolase
LGAPVGSLLVGTRDFIEQARIYRKVFGGGMRQVGVLAAAGLIALEKGPLRLEEDHRNARHLAEGLAAIPGVKIDPKKVQTNILVFDVSGTGLDANDIAKQLASEGVLAGAFSSTVMRMCTHLDVNRAQIDQALEIFGRVVAGQAVGAR